MAIGSGSKTWPGEFEPMGVRAIVWAFDQICPTPAAKLVLIKLADHADDEGQCWPSQARVAADTGLTRETVNRQVKLLASAGLLLVEQRTNGHGQQSNRYVLLCDRKSHQTPNSVTTDHTPVTGNHTPPVTTDHTPCDLSSHRTVIEPSKEEEEQRARAIRHEPAVSRSFGEAILVRYACGAGPNLPLTEAPPTEQTFAWPLIEDAQGKIVASEVPPEWVGDTYRSHPTVDGYAASEAFGAYWTEGKGAGTTRTEQDWKQCWRGWIGREKAARSTEWINRYGYNRHLHGHLVEAKGGGVLSKN